MTAGCRSRCWRRCGCGCHTRYGYGCSVHCIAPGEAGHGKITWWRVWILLRPCDHSWNQACKGSHHIISTGSDYLSFGLSFCFLHRPRHLLVDSHLTELLSLSFGLGVLVIIVLPRGAIPSVVHTSILRPLARRVSHHYVHGPVERSVPLVLRRRLSRLSRRVALGRKLVLLSLQNGQ